MPYKYDSETDSFVLTDKQMSLLLTPKERTHIATCKRVRKYVVVIVYKTGQHTIYTEPDFFDESVEAFLDYICEMSKNNLKETVAFVM